MYMGDNISLRVVCERLHKYLLICERIAIYEGYARGFEKMKTFVLANIYDCIRTCLISQWFWVSELKIYAGFNERHGFFIRF